ncbi:MAG: polysaccharide biosynthesis C-terminal domain-containing protein [Clostridiales bacterium]|nr:polysaccharide biosynthesis C-terminal domain-containing protein [Clostridiales bacterium]
MAQDNKMETMGMPELVADMSLPLIFSQLVQALYNVMDSVFVAKMGETALTAVSLAFPIQVFMSAIAVGTAVGVNVLLSISIGAGQRRVVENIASIGVLLSLINTALFMTAGVFGAGWFARMFTKDETIGELCTQYLRICMTGCAGSFVGIMFQCFLQASGDTFHSMPSMLIGVVMNVILDPILIFGMFGLPSLGISGAAIATVAAQWTSAVFAALFNGIYNNSIHIRMEGIYFDRRILLQIYRVGLPTIINQTLPSVMMTMVNRILINFSTAAVSFFRSVL